MIRLKFENTDVWGFKHALRGMRNPMNSWGKSDSFFVNDQIESEDNNTLPVERCVYYIGKKDIELAQKLIRAGSEHRKFLRQIFVSVDITAPLYWYKEMDTYKVGTVANSTSTMHKLISEPITRDCFEFDEFENIDDLSDEYEKTYINDIFCSIIKDCEELRKMYIETKNKKYWRALIQLLPESWLQKRTITMNYENVFNIVRQRENHKLIEWNYFIDWARKLPYASELIFLDEGNLDQ